MGILSQLRDNFTQKRIDKEVNEKVDRIRDLMKNGGSEEELTNAIADLTKPTEFNQAVGALMVVAPVWFNAKVLSKEEETFIGESSIQDLFSRSQTRSAMNDGGALGCSGQNRAGHAVKVSMSHSWVLTTILNN